MKTNNYGLIFTNLVDFDMKYGHRNDVEGYGNALIEFDNRLPEILSNLGEDDVLIITADHGCDPTRRWNRSFKRIYTSISLWKTSKAKCKSRYKKKFCDIGKLYLIY